MSPEIQLALYRLAATLDIEEARALVGAKEFSVDETINLVGTVKQGEESLSDDTYISWQTVAGFLLARMGATRKASIAALIDAVKNDTLSTLDVGAAKKQKDAFKKKVAKVRGKRKSAGKITGKITASLATKPSAKV